MIARILRILPDLVFLFFFIIIIRAFDDRRRRGVIVKNKQERGQQLYTNIKRKKAKRTFSIFIECV